MSATMATAASDSPWSTIRRGLALSPEFRRGLLGTLRSPWSPRQVASSSP